MSLAMISLLVNINGHMVCGLAFSALMLLVVLLLTEFVLYCECCDKLLMFLMKFCEMVNFGY